MARLTLGPCWPIRRGAAIVAPGPVTTPDKLISRAIGEGLQGTPRWLIEHKRAEGGTSTKKRSQPKQLPAKPKQQVRNEEPASPLKQ